MLRLGAPGALAATKAMLRAERPAATGRRQFAAMLELSARHFASEEGQEGMAAFAEKRPPAWVPHRDDRSHPGLPDSPGPEAADAVKISDGGAKAAPVRLPHRS